MMILPPQREIELYVDGFEGRDLLSRKKYGEYLSDLVSKSDQSLVISVDGAWGSGKSFFLKCWAGEHTIAFSDEATVIYFDAFAHDFLSDPLVGLTSHLVDRLRGEERTSQTALNNLRSAAARLWRPATRVALAFGTAGATEVAGPLVDAGLAAASDELSSQVEDFWRKEDGRRAAIIDFRNALSQLTDPTDGGAPRKKLVFIVDELDRCRPDFALDTLEVAKHFFSMPGVHFVLGVNMMELGNMVQSRYGDAFDASTYLEKFVSVKFSLPDDNGDEYRRKANSLTYFTAVSSEMGIQENLVQDADFYFKASRPIRPNSIRQSQRILTELALIPNVDNIIPRLYSGYRLVIVGLALLKIKFPKVYSRAREGTLSFDELSGVFDFQVGISNEVHASHYLDQIWRFVLAPDTCDERSDLSREFGHGISEREYFLSRQIMEFLDAFHFPTENED